MFILGHNKILLKNDAFITIEEKFSKLNLNKYANVGKCKVIYIHKIICHD